MADNAPPQTQPYGQVYDLGYRHYDGPRLGRAHAVRALTVYSIKRGLGIKKRWTAKIIPFVLYLIAFGPAMIAAGVSAFVPIDAFEISYYDVSNITTPVLLIFAAALGPEMLSDDRRENVLSLYFSRALTRLSYLLAKIAAMSLLMATIAFGPLLLLFIANVLLDNDPIGYFVDNLDDLGRIFAHGALVSAFLGALALSIAAYVNRKGVAGAVFIAGFFVVSGIVDALFEAIDSGLRRYLVLFSPGELLGAVSAWIFSEPQLDDMADMPGIAYVAAILVVVTIAAGIMYRRYVVIE